MRNVVRPSDELALRATASSRRSYLVDQRCAQVQVSLSALELRYDLRTTLQEIIEGTRSRASSEEGAHAN